MAVRPGLDLRSYIDTIQTGNEISRSITIPLSPILSRPTRQNKTAKTILHSCNTIALVITSFATSTWTHTRRTFAFQSHIRLKKLCLPPDGLNTAHKSITNVRDVVINQQKNRGASSTLLKQRLAFFDQIFGFLDRESISYRNLTINELHDIWGDQVATASPGKAGAKNPPVE